MGKKEISLTTADERRISFCAGDGEINPYMNYILAFKWYRMGELNETSRNTIEGFFKEKEMNV